VTDPNLPCACEAILVRLGFSQEERASLGRACQEPGLRAMVERAVARHALDDRLEALTALAGGLAHELNNPLAYVLSNLAFLADRTARLAAIAAGAPPAPGDAALATQVAEAMAEARTGAERMRGIVRDLRMLSHLDQPAQRPVDLHPVIESCLNVAWSELSRSAEIVRELGPIPRVIGDEGQLSQVFLSLFLNAARAIPKESGRPHQIRVSTRCAADGRATIEVSDTGAGIAPEHLDRIFDPFFSGRTAGLNGGLGLAICHVVVTSMGGEILVESEVGRGSTFRVLLPPATPAATS
jgi:signal transduction histidine kinase